jgi:hypothetical protein
LRPNRATPVYLNSRPYGRTTATGVLRAPIETGKYSVSVAKDGFRASGAQGVDLAKGEEKKLAFTLTPVPGVLSITGLWPGEEIRIDGRSRGVAGPSQTATSGPSQTATYNDLPAGQHHIDLLRDGYNPGRQEFQITEGKTTNLDATKLVLVKRESSPPTPPDPALIEARDWERLRNSNSADDLQIFLNQHANGQHAEDARTRINQLRQAQVKDAQVKDSEDKALRAQESAWSSVDTSQSASLRDFIARYGNSPHAPEARTLLNTIEKRDADEQAARRREEQRLRDQEAVKQTLARYEGAFGAMDFSKLQEVWGGAPNQIAQFKEQFRQARRFDVQLSLIEPPTVNGDAATARCTRTVRLTPKAGAAINPRPDRVQVVLVRAGSTWLIRSITPF